MGTTAQKLQAILDSKAAIKQQLNSITIGGQYMTPTDKISDWSQMINGFYRDIKINSVNKLSQFQLAYGAKNGTYGGDVYNNTKWLGDPIRSVAFFPNTQSGVLIAYSNVFSDSFAGCANLQTIAFPSGGLTLRNTGVFLRTFQGCTSLTSVTIKINSLSSGSNHFQESFRGCTGITDVELTLPQTWETSNQSFNGMFRDCTRLKRIKVKGLKTLSKNGSVWYFGGGTNNWLAGTSGIDEIEMSDLETITNTTTTGTGVLALTPQGQTSSNAPKTLKFPKLTSLSVMDGESTSYFSTFVSSLQTASTAWCYVKDIYLPVCTYVGYNAFNMLNGTKVHFAAANQSTIQSLSGYSRSFLTYGNCQILFDL